MRLDGFCGRHAGVEVRWSGEGVRCPLCDAYRHEYEQRMADAQMVEDALAEPVRVPRDARSFYRRAVRGAAAIVRARVREVLALIRAQPPPPSHGARP